MLTVHLLFCLGNGPLAETCGEQAGDPGQGGICWDIKNRGVLSWERGHACPSQHLVNRCQLLVAKDNSGTEHEPKTCLSCLTDREGIWLLSVAQQRTSMRKQNQPQSPGQSLAGIKFESKMK